MSAEITEIGKNTSAKVVSDLIRKIRENDASVAAVICVDGEIEFILDAWNESNLELIGAVEVLKNSIISAE